MTHTSEARCDNCGFTPANERHLCDPNFGRMVASHSLPQEKPKEESWEEDFYVMWGNLNELPFILEKVEKLLQQRDSELAGKVEGLKKPRGLARSHSTSAKKIKKWNTALDEVKALLTNHQ